jgi:hypothetical protein
MIAVYDTNAEYRMSIQAVRDALKHLPGGDKITMRYGDGGRTQVFTIGEQAVEVGPEATTAEIEAAFNESKKKLQTPLTTQSLQWAN